MVTMDLQRPSRKSSGTVAPPGAHEVADASPPRRIRVRRELPSGRAVVGALLVTTAAVATFVVARDDDAAPTTTYVVATRDLAPGALLGPSDLGVVALDLPIEVAASAFTDPDDVLAAVTRGPVAAGGLLTGAVVAAEGITDGEGEARYREVSFAVPSARALLGGLVPGDRVDVVATLDERSTVLVQHALVLGATRGGDDALVVSDDVVITLALEDGADALAVAHGAAVGELTVLRSTRADDELPAMAPSGEGDGEAGPAGATGAAGTTA